MDSISDSDSEDAGSIPAGATIFVYCLSNSLNREIYVGISNDVERRLTEHNSGKNRYTKAFARGKLSILSPIQTIKPLAPGKNTLKVMREKRH
jgi:predicted GIY-YIG superfamily endonuclease